MGKTFNQIQREEREMRRLRQSAKVVRRERARIQRERELRNKLRMAADEPVLTLAVPGARLDKKRRKLAVEVFTQFDESKPMARVRALLRRFLFS